MKPTYEVEGGRELRKQLKAAGIDMKDLKEAHKKASAIAAAEAVRRAPKRTGALANSVRASGTITAGVIRIGFNKSVPYANPIHWGWGRRKIKANPFASKAAQATEKQWIKLYEEHKEKILNSIKGKT